MRDDVHIPSLVDGVTLPIKVLNFFFLYKYVLLISTKKKKDKPFTVKPQYYVCRVLPKRILRKQNSGMNTMVANPPTGMISQFLLAGFNLFLYLVDAIG
jgi:hypothetical protein